MAEPNADQAARIREAKQRLDALNTDNQSHHRAGAFDSRLNGDVTLSLGLDHIFELLALAEKGKAL